MMFGVLFADLVDRQWKTGRLDGAGQIEESVLTHVEVFMRSGSCGEGATVDDRQVMEFS